MDILLAGLPRTVVFDLTLVNTTAPIPTVASSATLTLGWMVAPEPINTLSPIST